MPGCGGGGMGPLIMGGIGSRPLPMMGSDVEPCGCCCGNDDDDDCCCCCDVGGTVVDDVAVGGPGGRFKPGYDIFGGIAPPTRGGCICGGGGIKGGRGGILYGPTGGTRYKAAAIGLCGKCPPGGGTGPRYIPPGGPGGGVNVCCCGGG
jgi:hypothetical protein